MRKLTILLSPVEFSKAYFNWDKISEIKYFCPDIKSRIGKKNANNKGYLLKLSKLNSLSRKAQVPH